MEKNKPCPLCNRSQFSVMADKKLERELLGLKVYCVNKDKGCKWMGDLRELSKHCSSVANSKSVTGVWTSAVNNLDGCSYEVITCTKCKKSVQRSKLNDHLSKSCVVPNGECRFRYAGCTQTVSSKDLKRHLEENMALHLSLIMDFTRNLSEENTRMSEYLTTLSSEVLDGELQQERRQIILRRNQDDGQILQPPQVGRRGQRRSLLPWIGGSLLFVLLSFLAAQNKDTLMAYIPVVNTLRYPTTDEFDQSEVYLALGDMEDKINLLTKDVNLLKQTMESNTDKLQAMMVDLKLLEKAAEGWSDVSQSIKVLNLQLPDDLKFKFNKLSNDLAEMGNKMASKDSFDQLQQKLDALASLRRELDSLQQRVTNTPRPLSRDEITSLVVNELEARRPPHHPPHHHHHGHGHGGCRGRH